VLVEPVRIAHPVRRAGQPFHLQLHQPLRGKTDHLAQQIGVGSTSWRRSIIASVISGPRLALTFGNQTLPKTRDDHRCG
jgi:hypothetical protein